MRKRIAWIDAHCHLTDQRFEASLKEVLRRSRDSNVKGWILGGVDPKDWEKQISLHKEYPAQIKMSFGLHPWVVAKGEQKELEAGFEKLKELGKKAHAVGELGLDFHPKHAAPETFSRQTEFFESQIKLALALQKPMVLHIVKAHSQALEILRGLGPFSKGGLVHSFSGSVEDARGYLELGFFLSFSGAIAREGYRSVKEALHSLPLEKIVIETDAPDQAPPWVTQGNWNEPRELVRIAESIGRLKGVEAEEALNQSRRNLENVFGEWTI
jgi:TatD DNase family protein